jgi:hypothetical protein
MSIFEPDQFRLLSTGTVAVAAQVAYALIAYERREPVAAFNAA